MAAPGLPDDEALRALAREIVERPEYARWSAVDTALARQLTDLLGRFLDWMRTLADVSPLLYWAILAGLLLVAVLLLAHVVVSLRSVLASRGAAKAEPLRAEPPRFADQAEALARGGHFLDASRRLQLACIDTLLRRGQLELRRFEPNRTLRRRIGAAPIPPAERERLGRLVQRLETRLFRDRVDDRALYEDWRAFHARLSAGSSAT